MNLRIASRFATKDLGVFCVELSIRDSMPRREEDKMPQIDWISATVALQ